MSNYCVVIGLCRHCTWPSWVNLYVLAVFFLMSLLMLLLLRSIWFVLFNKRRSTYSSGQAAFASSLWIWKGTIFPPSKNFIRFKNVSQNSAPTICNTDVLVWEVFLYSRMRRKSARTYLNSYEHVQYWNDRTRTNAQAFRVLIQNVYEWIRELLESARTRKTQKLWVLVWFSIPLFWTHKIAPKFYPFYEILNILYYG